MSLTTESKMSNENDGWETIEVSEDKKEVDFEIEEEEEQQPVQAKEEEQPEQEEKPKELEGIETKGAEKRIRQLIRQRKEREEKIDEHTKKKI